MGERPFIHPHHQHRYGAPSRQAAEIRQAAQTQEAEERARLARLAPDQPGRDLLRDRERRPGPGDGNTAIPVGTMALGGSRRSEDMNGEAREE